MTKGIHMTMLRIPVFYYAHRFGGDIAELRKARQRSLDLTVQGACERMIFAPWITLAGCGVPEESCWPVIEASISACDGIIIDLDGGEMSPGMLREREYAEKMGKKVEVLP